MQVVTSGSAFLDIDAYGGCIAFAELLQKQGFEAVAASSAPLNESITPEIRGWNAPLLTDYQVSADDRFTVIDVSDTKFFDPLIDVSRVERIIDHHPGYEAEWAKLGDKSTIDFIGAACTLVYEQWQQAGLFDEMSVVSARLLTAGILDNTLDLKANVTTDRDRQAYVELERHASFEIPDWPAKYFADCQQTIETDLVTALRNDTKHMSADKYLPRAFGQLVVWDAQALLATRRREIADALQKIDNDWAINIVSIKDDKSYFMADDPARQVAFGELMDIDLSSGFGVGNRLWLRKEILKRAQTRVN